MVKPLESGQEQAALSLVIVTLMKGVLYRSVHPDLWQSLLRLHAQVHDYVRIIGLELALDESEGYAYLRQREPAEGDESLPRLVVRRQLGYHVSLLLALLRKKLAEHDATGGDLRLIMTRDQIAELLRLFLPETADEVRFMKRIDRDIKQIVDLGFMRRLKGPENRFEVLRILSAFVDAQWLAALDQRLAEYRERASSVEE